MIKIYTEKDCLLKENKNLFKDYEIILDENNKLTKWQKSKDEYCEYCNAVYKNKCDDAAIKINSRIFNDNSKEAFKNLYIDKINKKCKEIYDKTNINTSDNSIINYKRDTKLIYNKLKSCMDYRIGHHLNCVRYTGNDKEQISLYLKNKGDTSHKQFIDNLENTVNNCLNTYNYLKTIKTVKSQKYMSKEQDKVKFRNFKRHNIKKSNRSIKYKSTQKNKRLYKKKRSYVLRKIRK
jgi:hypothetical protein